MAGERIKLFEADIDVDGIVKKSGELKQAIMDAKDAMVLAKFQTGETSKEYIKAEANVKKLSAEYRVNQQQIINLTNANGNLLTIEQKLTTALDKEVKSIDSAVANNKELRKIRNSVNTETEEGQKAIAEINKKIDENTAFIKANTDSYSQQKMEIGDYKNAIKDAYNELNIFNGGILGFVQRAQAAGGVMPLVKNGLTGITQGIMGATKASLAFIATPIGAVIAAIGLVLGAVIGYLKSTQKGIDLVTSVTRPLTAIMETLGGVLQEVGEFLFEAFSNPKKTIKEVYDFVKDKVIRVFEGYWKILSGIATLDFSKAKEGLSDITDVAVEGIDAIKNATGEMAKRMKEAYERGVQIDELTKEVEKREVTLNLEREKALDAIKEQELIAKDASKTTKEREAAAKEAVRLAREQAEAEKEILDLKIRAMELEQMNNDTSRDQQKELNDLRAERVAKDREAKERELSFIGELAAAEKQRRDDAKAAAEKAFNDSIKRQQLELQIYLESQGIKKRTMAEELKLAEEASAKLIDIERQKLEKKKITEEEFKLFVIQSEKDLALKRVEIANENLDRELEAFKKNHEEKLAAGKFFSEEAYKQEQERLALLLEEERQHWESKLELGVINQEEYNAQINRINEENQLALDEAKLAREEAEKEKQAIDLENRRAAQIENLEYDLEFQLQELDRKRQQELEAAEKTGADLAAIEAKYAKMRKDIEDGVQMNKLQLASETAGNLATIVGKETALGKAAAITQTTIETYKAAVSAYSAMSAIPVVGPVLGAVAAAAAVAMGLANVKKIASAKPPKAERGAVFNIGGKRHSQGGTKFYGEDGSAFEAEKDEKMFILNRRASEALGPLLSDINQQYGGISLSRASSYLAAGGQVLRGQANAATVPQFDYDKMAQVVGEGVRQGSREGSLEGSSRGTYSGMVDKETNEMIAAGANF